MALPSARPWHTDAAAGADRGGAAMLNVAIEHVDDRVTPDLFHATSATAL